MLWVPRKARAPMPSFAPRLAVLLLCGTALCACSTMTATKTDKLAQDKAAAVQPAAKDDLDGNLRQARMLRQAGQYDQAISVLSQLMLVASDNPQVVAEYGKTLAQKGRAQDAVQFLHRAIELSPNDWTLYSAMGVSYDQVDDQVNARIAYEHALALQPDEASVLNNYALSRMLAKDPQGAQLLIAKAQAAATPGDKKIADNVALIASLQPKPAKGEDAKPAIAGSAAPRNVAAAAPAKPDAGADAKKAAQAVAGNAPLPLPVAAPAIASNTQSGNVSTGAPRSLTPNLQTMPASVQAANAAPLPPYPDVVMQAVPVDPYAGPVALHMPKAKPKTVASAARADDAKAEGKSDAKPQAAKADAAKSDGKAPAKAQANASPAPAKTAQKDIIPALRVAAEKY
jgi:Flp pilus assembly protein TadD